MYDVLQMVTSKGSSKPSSDVAATTIYTKTEIEKIAESLNIDGINAMIENQSLNIEESNAKIENQFLNQSIENADMKAEIIKLKQENQDQQAINYNINRKMSELKQKNQEQQSTISDLSHTGSWCAYQDWWTTNIAVIKYDKILHADSNMNKNALNMGNGEI